MSIKKIFNQQFQLRNFFLHHDASSDFYLSCFQRNRSTVPLLIIRTLIFVGCLSIWIASMVLTARYMSMEFWAIYMTHWGLILNTLAAGCGLFVSVMATIKLPVDNSSILPWYVKVYWVLFNIATPVAFFITVFYWTLLTGVEQDFAINLTLDIFIHAVNSILMCALLLSSRQPTYFFHFYIPIALAAFYLVFSYIYYISGGTDAFGLHTIYPMIDWEKPGATIGIAVLCTIGITILHGLVVALSTCRDVLDRRFTKTITAYNVPKTF